MTDQSHSRRRPAITHERGEILMVLAALQDSPAGSHPDDELLAAWHARALDATSSADVERHVALCDRCFTVWTTALNLEAAPDAAPARNGWFANLVSMPAGRVGALAVAVLAAVALSVSLLDRAPVLPDYTVSLEGNTQYFRNGTATTPETVTFQAGNLFQLVLQPDTAYDGAVDATLYLVDTNDTLTRLQTPPAEVTNVGALRIEAEVGRDVRLPAGRRQLLVVVGARGHLPSRARLQQALSGQTMVAHDYWRAWRMPIEIVGD